MSEKRWEEEAKEITYNHIGLGSPLWDGLREEIASALSRAYEEGQKNPTAEATRKAEERGARKMHERWVIFQADLHAKTIEFFGEVAALDPAAVVADEDGGTLV